MKKAISVICIVLLLLQVILPQMSYAEEIIKDNTVQNEEENKNESNGDESSKESNVESNVDSNVDSNVIKDDNVITEETTNVIDENFNETIENEINEDSETEEENINKEDNVDEEETSIIQTDVTDNDTIQSRVVEAGNVKFEEGIYTIRSVLPGNRAVGIDAGSTENGANVNLWDYLQVGQQKFRIKMDSKGYYEIENIKSNKLLDVVGSGQASGTNVDQWEYNGGYDNQKWIIEKGIEAYKIKSKVNGLYLNLENGVGANGENVNVETGADIETQEFLIERIDEDGTETILNGTTNKIITKLSGRAVGVDGGRLDNGANINLWDYIRVNQQRFKFIYNVAGYYTIVNENSGKLLDVVSSGSKSGTPVDQWEDNGGNDNQKWIVKDIGNGYYNIISKLNGLYLTVGGNGNNCDLMYVENPTGRDNQKFQIIESGVPQGEKTIEDGTYKIVLANAPTQSLTVDGGKIDDGANVHIWEYIDTPQQQFNLVYDGTGYYEIIPVHSGKRLDVVGYGNEANVDQWSDNGGNDNQRWVIRKSKSGNYNIISKRDSLYLDAYQSKTENGTNIEVYDQSGGAGQEFKLEKIDNQDDPVDSGNQGNQDNQAIELEEGTYKIVLASAPTQSLTVDGGKRENGANVHIWEYIDTPQQQFNIVDAGDGYYEIIPVHSGKRLDVVGFGNGTNVDQWENNGGNNNQKWKFVKSDLGNYNIISQREDLYLDAYYSYTANGTNIQVYEKSGGAGQEFRLEKIDDKSERTLVDSTYKISPQSNTNLVVEASASNTDNNGRLQIWANLNMKAQKIKLEYLDGYYRISLAHSNKCLTVKDGIIESGSDVVQYDWNGGINQKWIIRDNGDGSVGVLPAGNNSLTLDIYGPIENGSKLELYNNEKNIKQKFVFKKTGIGVNIDTSKYPGISEAIDKLVEQHPNWQFEILYTGIDFNTAVQGEYEYRDSNGQPANLVDTSVYKGDWIAPNPIVSRNWALASYDGIAYFMDPRNFLNDTDVFQFLDLSNYSDSGATLESITSMVSGTFLEGYASDVMAACQETNTNPYFILSRLIQEQGNNGSATINMDGGDGKLYYNPFNYSASVGDEVNTALARAKQEGWDTMQKGLAGGIRILRKNYIDANQNTLYLNKFDVNPASPGGFYSHQYMQNVSAAYTEARRVREYYASTGALDNTIKFIVPVFENMPSEASPKPSNSSSNTGSNVNSKIGPISVQIATESMSLALRSEPSTQGGNTTVIKRLDKGTRLFSIARLDNGWDKVITLDGIIGYCSREYLNANIDDINTCDERVRVTSSNGINLRAEPSQYSTKIIGEKYGTTGTRLVKGIYYAEEHSWDIVKFDDGYIGFVASDYLEVI